MTLIVEPNMIGYLVLFLPAIILFLTGGYVFFSRILKGYGPPEKFTEAVLVIAFFLISIVIFIVTIIVIVKWCLFLIQFNQFPTFADFFTYLNKQ